MPARKRTTRPPHSADSRAGSVRGKSGKPPGPRGKRRSPRSGAATDERNPAAGGATADSGAVRLQKVLARAGYGSRRHCEEFIEAGRVTVDGNLVLDLGVKVDIATQDVRVDDERIRPEPKRYFVLNKPPGYVCTNHDPEGRPCAIDLFPADGPRLFTVGRLDETSQGLLIVTNDGELANRLAHPRYRVPRKYQVQVAGKPGPETIQQLKDGVHFEDGKYYVTSVRTIRTQGKSTHLEIELRQGRNREIRRLFARLDHKVMHLERVTFGPVKLGRLGLGKYRPMRDGELAELQALVASTGDVPVRPRKRKATASRRRVDPHTANVQPATDGKRKTSTRPASVSRGRVNELQRRALQEDDEDERPPAGMHPASARRPGNSHPANNRPANSRSGNSRSGNQPADAPAGNRSKQPAQHKSAGGKSGNRTGKPPASGSAARSTKASSKKSTGKAAAKSNRTPSSRNRKHNS